MDNEKGNSMDVCYILVNAPNSANLSVRFNRADARKKLQYVDQEAYQQEVTEQELITLKIANITLL